MSSEETDRYTKYVDEVDAYLDSLESRGGEVLTKRMHTTRNVLYPG